MTHEQVAALVVAGILSGWVLWSEAASIKRLFGSLLLVPPNAVPTPPPAPAERSKGEVLDEAAADVLALAGKLRDAECPEGVVACQALLTVVMEQSRRIAGGTA